MPYIKQEHRSRLDPHIENLAQEIQRIAEEEKDPLAFAGLFNYTCTKLGLRLLPERRYKWIALLVGVFETVKQEFYRRFAGPYEDEQIEKNGDVYPGGEEDNERTSEA